MPAVAVGFTLIGPAAPGRTTERFMADDIASLRRILAEVRTVAMVGLSGNWYRPYHAPS